MQNREIWDKVKQPPGTVLKQIGGGRLKGMTDISPQWRYEVMTDIFGPIGIGWNYKTVETWERVGTNDQVMLFAKVEVKFKHGKEWSEPIEGIGGSMLIAKESSGLHSSDEAYKMAVTDAISVALKMLGVGADVYAGKWDGSKYKDPTSGTDPQKIQPKPDYKFRQACEEQKKRLGDELYYALIVPYKSSLEAEGLPYEDKKKIVDRLKAAEPKGDSAPPDDSAELFPPND